MTRLERLWEDLPIGPAPTREILRAGRQNVAERRRRALRRPLLTAGVAATVVVAFLAGTLVVSEPSGAPTAQQSDSTGGDAPADSVAGSDASPVAFTTGLNAAGSCEQLRQSYIDRSLGHVTAYGWDAGQATGLAVAEDAFAAGPVVPQATAGKVPRTERVTASDTGTNVQEAGVDEPDSVKTGGSVLVRVRRGKLAVYDVTGAAPVALASLDLPKVTDAELLLAGETVVAIGTDATGANHGSGPTGTRVLTIDITDPQAPTITDDVAYSSSLLGARQHGDVVRLTLSAGLPDLDFVQPGDGDETALQTNRAKVEASTIEDWLPTYDDGSGVQQLLDCERVAIPDEDDLGLDTVSIVGFDVSSPTRLSAIGLAAATTIAYESDGQLFLAASPSTIWTDCWSCAGTPGNTVGTSYLFDFALDGIEATHVASGLLDGTVADRWSLDYAGDTLRVALGSSARTDDDNAIVTLRRNGSDLVEAGRLGGLGAGEQIMSVRWFDDLAILVTYRQVDPLYAVSLADPAAPVLLSKLKIPGFSSYLHPLGPDRLVGVGQADWNRGQLGLFDVTDLADVRQLDVIDYGKQTTTLAGQDPRTVTWLPAQRAVLTLIQRKQTGYLSIVEIAHGKLTDREIEVAHGNDIAGVRTIGLPDDRVLLISGDEVTFLDL